MTLTIELEDALATEVRRRSEAAGQTTLDYIQGGIRQRLSQEHRSAVIESALERIRQSGASLGRGGRPWQEISHEGHRY